MTTAKYTVLFIFSLAILALVSLVQAQEVKKLKLPNGEEVMDIRGEWDAELEHSGPWSGLGTYTNVIKITQEGNSFVGIRMKIDKRNLPNSVAFRGELDKDGIKKLTWMGDAGPMDMKGEVIEDANKIIIDFGEKGRATLIRK
ncbi:MAG: hypothetical protein JSV50_10490 [Desulfobacteraceae bacterium]|nr:MAG: hypothetical protein JSV50_10490 [Desulfobacteraceae bacterium]